MTVRSCAANPYWIPLQLNLGVSQLTHTAARMDRDLATYVSTYFCALMTPKEREAERHLTTVFKMMDGRSDPAAQAEAWARGGPRRRWMSEDPEVLRLAEGGLEEFRAQFAARVLAERPDDVFLNRCPRCDALTWTPRAKLCLHCGHSWHHAAAG